MKHSILLCALLAACTTSPETTGQSSQDVVYGPCTNDTQCGLDGACVNAACTERCGVRPPCTDSYGRDVADCQYYSCSYDVDSGSLCIAGDTFGDYIWHHHQEGWSSGSCLNWAPNGEICPRGAYDQVWESCSGEP